MTKDKQTDKEPRQIGEFTGDLCPQAQPEVLAKKAERPVGRGR